jgi:hypothetical protein
MGKEKNDRPSEHADDWRTTYQVFLVCLFLFSTPKKYEVEKKICSYFFLSARASAFRSGLPRGHLPRPAPLSAFAVCLPQPRPLLQNPNPPSRHSRHRRLPQARTIRTSPPFFPPPPHRASNRPASSRRRASSPMDEWRAGVRASPPERDSPSMLSPNPRTYGEFAWPLTRDLSTSSSVTAQVRATPHALSQSPREISPISD